LGRLPFTRSGFKQPRQPIRILSWPPSQCLGTRRGAPCGFARTISGRSSGAGRSYDSAAIRVVPVRLAEWTGAWTCVAQYTSADVPEVDRRISRVRELWRVPIAAEWLRSTPEDGMWAAAPYRRGDRGTPSSPERAIEHEILGPEATIAPGRACLGGAVVGGINAVPLTSTPKIERPASPCRARERASSVLGRGQGYGQHPVVRDDRTPATAAPSAVPESGARIFPSHRRDPG
jgi:hypothetical protein